MKAHCKNDVEILFGKHYKILHADLRDVHVGHRLPTRSTSRRAYSFAQQVKIAKINIHYSLEYGSPGLKVRSWWFPDADGCSSRCLDCSWFSTFPFKTSLSTLQLQSRWSAPSAKRAATAARTAAARRDAPAAPPAKSAVPRVSNTATLGGVGPSKVKPDHCIPPHDLQVQGRTLPLRKGQVRLSRGRFRTFMREPGGRSGLCGVYQQCEPASSVSQGCKCCKA